MEATDQRCRPDKLFVRPRGKVRGDVALDERHDLPAPFVDAEYPRGPLEPYLLQVA